MHGLLLMAREQMRRLGMDHGLRPALAGELLDRGPRIPGRDGHELHLVPRHPTEHPRAAVSLMRWMPGRISSRSRRSYSSASFVFVHPCQTRMIIGWSPFGAGIAARASLITALRSS